MNGGQNREDQQVMEEFDRVKVLESYDLKEIQTLADCLVSVKEYFSKVNPGFDPTQGAVSSES